MILSEMILNARKHKGMTQEELADRIGVTDVYISMIEKGRRVPSDEIAMKLANELDLDKPTVVLSARQAGRNATDDVKEVFEDAASSASFFRELKGLSDDDKNEVSALIQRLKKKNDAKEK